MQSNEFEVFSSKRSLNSEVRKPKERKQNVLNKKLTQNILPTSESVVAAGLSVVGHSNGGYLVNSGEEVEPRTVVCREVTSDRMGGKDSHSPTFIPWSPTGNQRKNERALPAAVARSQRSAHARRWPASRRPAVCPFLRSLKQRGIQILRLFFPLLRSRWRRRWWWIRWRKKYCA